MVSTAQPSSHKRSAIVCGSLHLDIVVTGPHLPQIDETVMGSEVKQICGGKGGNQAVSLAAQGIDTRMFACIGNDGFGQTLKENLLARGVDCSQLQEVEGASGMSVAIVDSSGDYGAVVVSASNLELDVSVFALPDDCEMVLLQNEVPLPVNRSVAALAKQAGVPVIYNCAPYRRFPDSMLSDIDTLVVNRVEAASIFECDGMNEQVLEDAMAGYAPALPHLIVTLGSDGVLYRDSKGNMTRLNTFSVDVVSTHGAGDVFCGALASSRMGGREMVDAISFAQASAALFVSTPVEARRWLKLEDTVNFLSAYSH